MAAMSIPHVPIPVILIAIVALYAIRRIYYELTTGARRRKTIKDNGCEEVVWYRHQGILGKLFGLDYVKAMVEAGKEGRMHEATRIRNWSDGKKTMKVKLPSSTGQYTRSDFSPPTSADSSGSNFYH